MKTLWVPQPQPPLISTDAKHAVTERFLEKGVIETCWQTLDRLTEENEPLAEYLEMYGFVLNKYHGDISWPMRTLKVGASLGFMAYREAGYYHTVDENILALGSLKVSLDGIPDAYLSSAWEDSELTGLVDLAISDPGFKGDDGEFWNKEGGGHRQVLQIGAGCTRFYLQQALAA